MTWSYVSGVLLLFVVLQIIPNVTGKKVAETSYNFLSVRGNAVVTSSGNVTSHGTVILLTSVSFPYGVLDLQGTSYLAFHPEPCLADPDACLTGFTIIITFRNTRQPVSGAQPSRVYLLDAGSNDETVDSGNFTGVALYWEEDRSGKSRLFCVLGGATSVWKLETSHKLVPGVWMQLEVSWHPVLGLTLWSGLNMLAISVHGQPRPTVDADKSENITRAPVRVQGEGQTGSARGGRTAGGVLNFGSERNPASSHLQISGLSFVELYVAEIFTGGLSDVETPSSTPSQQPSTPITTTSPNTAITSEQEAKSTRSPTLDMVMVSFLAVAGDEILTTLGTMATQGSVFLEPVPAGQTLVLDEVGESVDLGSPLPCLRDVSSCRDGFSLRITFQLLKVSLGHNILLSSGGDQLDSVGVTLSYLSSEMIVFIVKTSVSTWMGLFSVRLQPWLWYTVDGSWDGHTNGSLYVNNQPLDSLAYNIPHPLSLETHPMHIATGPGHQSTSTLMKVFEVVFWATDRASVRNEELDLPALSSYPAEGFTVHMESTVSTGKKDDATTKEPEISQRLENSNDGGVDNNVVVIVLSAVCGAVVVAAVVGVFVCLRSRRLSNNELRLLRRQHRASLSVDYPFRTRSTAFHNQSFPVAPDEAILY